MENHITEAATSSHNNAKVTNGLIMQLNQDVFDDGDRADIDDLATLAQAVIQNIDFNAMFTNPIVHSDGFDSNGDGARDQQTFNDCGATCGVQIIGSCHTETHYEEGWWVTKTNSITYDAPVIEEITTTSAGLVVKMSVSNLVMPLNVFSNYKGDSMYQLRHGYCR